MLIRLRQLILVVALISLLLPTLPAYAGDPPDGVIGPMNPTMYECVDGDNVEIFQPDPFIKRTEERFFAGGNVIEFTVTDENGDPIFDGGPALLDPDFRDDNPDANMSTCDNPMGIDFGFNPRDAVEYEAYLRGLEDACDEADGKLRRIEKTRVEGFVYEFHQNADGEWFSVPSKSVPVSLRGITFDLEWGTNDEGYFFFENLGAGPMVTTPRLPPDAHPINPNVILFSSGLEQTWTVFLGFYRGPNAPEDVSQLRTPNGNFLPFSSQIDLNTLQQCGYLGTPAAVDLPPQIADLSFGMPGVGGVPNSEPALSQIILAMGLLLILVTGGVFHIYRRVALW